ncbi:MAG: DUF2383 domain-containing protein [Rhodobacteraceae bacterium]|nr:MAG: DUF2383 domain-containing protein [Paracoccaceae bacterium]
MPSDTTGHMPPKLAPDATAETPVAAGTGPGPDPKETALDLIAEAHTRVVDTVSGFEKLVEKAAPGFRQVAETFLDMHVRHADALSAYLAQEGRRPDEDGSVFATVNRAVIEMRSWFETVDHDIMDRVAEGEKHVLDAYQDAKDAEQSIEANAMLARHMSEIDIMLSTHKD